MIKYRSFIGIIVSALLTISYSCTDNDTPEDEYLDNKTIEGSWIGDVSPDSLTIEFSKGRCKYEYYAYMKIENGKDTLMLESNLYSDYKLTDSTIIILDRPDIIFKYKLSKNNPDVFYIDVPYPWTELNRVVNDIR